MRKLLFLILLTPVMVFGQGNGVKIPTTILTTFTISSPLKDTLLVGVNNILTIAVKAPYKTDNVVIDCPDAKLMKGATDGSFIITTTSTEPITITIKMNNKVIGQRIFKSMVISDKMA